jgi:hypothetical protein
MADNSLRNEHHDFGPTEKELAGLLVYIENVSFHRVLLDRPTPGAASVEEYQDRGRDALLAAWEHWDGWHVPFYAYARQCIWQQMRGATRKYHIWALPGGRSPLDAAMIGRVVAQDTAEDGTGGTRELFLDPPESMAWFYWDLARHWSCMSPTMRQALKDTLVDLPREDIMARDGVSKNIPNDRYVALVTFLRRHVVDRDTSCVEEQEGWKRRHGQPLVDPATKAAKANARRQRWRASNREHLTAYFRAHRQRKKAGASLAAADRALTNA